MLRNVLIMFENARKCPTQYIMLRNKIRNKEYQKLQEHWKLQDSVSKCRKTLKVPGNGSQCQSMLGNVKKIENDTECKELQRRVKKILQNAHISGLSISQRFRTFFMYIYCKSGIGSCIAPNTGFARHPVKGMYALFQMP